MIVITGATGQLGRLVIEQLLKTVPASQIVAAVRSPEKAADLAAQGIQVRQADYTRPASLDSAFAGAEKLLLISSNELGQRFTQHSAVIDAAKRAKVRLLAYTSVLHADTSVLALAEEHRQTEAALDQSGIDHVLLRNGWYTENTTAAIPGILAHDAQFGSAGDGRFSSAARADYAAAAAAVLTASDNQAGRIYELAGDEAFTLTQFAAEVGRQTGKAIGYTNLPEADFKAALIQAGFPEEFAALLADSDTGASKGALFDNSRQLSKLIGRPTTPWTQVVATALGK
jgi:NAD(P)H dehydrogenase (quinone)